MGDEERHAGEEEAREQGGQRQAREVPRLQGHEGEDGEWVDQGGHCTEQERKVGEPEEVGTREEVRPREGVEGVFHEGPGRDGDARLRGDEWPVGPGEGSLRKDQVLLLYLSARVCRSGGSASRG